MHRLKRIMLMSGSLVIGSLIFVMTPVKAADPIGWFEAALCDTRNGSGWTCDPDDFNANLQVLVYDGLRGTGGPTAAIPVANVSRSDVSSACGGKPQHGFLFTLPWWLIDGKNHSLYAYARDSANSNTLVQLNGNPININCPKRDPVMTFTATPATISTGGSSTLTWSSDADICYIDDGSAGSGNIVRQANGSLTVSPTGTMQYAGGCMAYGLAGSIMGVVNKKVVVTVTGTGTTGVCGPAVKSYAYNESAYTGALCNVGQAPTGLAFPSPGGSVTWTCLVGGTNPSPPCTATRSATATSFVCTGTIPAHASMYPNDDVGLTANTPYSYWATDTGTRCQYSCDAGYTWNGSACAATTGGGTPRPNPDLKIAGSDGPVTFSQGASYAITWSAVSNATSCTGTGPNWDGTKATSGGYDDLSANMTSGTYTLTCTGPGGTASDSIVVNIQSSGGGNPSGLPDFQAYGNPGAYKTVRANTLVDLTVIFGDEMGVGTKADLEVKFQMSNVDHGNATVWTDIGTKNIGPLVGKQRKTVTLQTTFSQIGLLMLRICIDPRNVVPEISEQNNCVGVANWSVVGEDGGGIVPGAPGSSCVGDTSKKTGICSASCGTASSESSNSCGGGLTCCLGGSANNTGASCSVGTGSGTCQFVANCNGMSTSVNTCTGGTLCCTTPASSGGGTPPASCPTYTGTIVTAMGNTTGNVIGSGPFASSSDLGAAAVFSGLISSGEWVRLSVDGVGLVNSFSGSTKNGVTSTSSGADCGQNISVSNYYCSGTLPTNSVWWTAADYNLQQAGVSWQHAPADTSRACEFHCNTGFTWNGSECVKDAGSPAPSTCASQGGTGCAATCQGASVTASDCVGSTNLCCQTAPTASGCTPSSACAATICAGTTCSDGCGGEVGGAKDCAGSGVVNALTKCTDGFDLKGNLCIPKIGSTSLSNMSVLELMKKVMNWILSILAVLTIIAIVISGVRYLVSAGDEEMAATAKRNLTYAIVGLAIALSGLIIVNAIAGLLGAG